MCAGAKTEARASIPRSYNARGKLWFISRPRITEAVSNEQILVYRSFYDSSAPTANRNTQNFMKRKPNKLPWTVVFFLMSAFSKFRFEICLFWKPIFLAEFNICVFQPLSSRLESYSRGFFTLHLSCVTKQNILDLVQFKFCIAFSEVKSAKKI